MIGRRADSTVDCMTDMLFRRRFAAAAAAVATSATTATVCGAPRFSSCGLVATALSRGPAAADAVARGHSMSRGRQRLSRSRTPPVRAPRETVVAVWRRKWHAASARLDRVDYLVASAETRPSNTAADLGAKLAALVSLWQHRAEVLHLLKMLEDEERGLGDASPPSLRTRS